MKEMSLQQAVEFWTYLHSQEELKKRAYFSTPQDSPYKDEVRAEAETYQGLAKVFAENFEQPLTSAEAILHGLTAQQAAGFLAYLDEEINAFKAALENTQRKGQAALASVHDDMEFSRVKSIYKAMKNQGQDQIIVFEKARKSFISILEEN